MTAPVLQSKSRFHPRSRPLPLRILEGLQRAPLLLAAFAGIGGIVAIDQGLTVEWTLVGFLLMCAAGCLWHRYRSVGILIASFSLFLFLFGWRHQDRLDSIRRFPLSSVLGAGQTVEIQGEGWVAGAADYGTRSVTTTVRLRQLVIGGQNIACDHVVPAWIQKMPEGLIYGTAIRFTGRLLPLEAPGIQGGFDAREFYFRRSGSLAKLEIREGDRLEILPDRKGSSLVSFAWKLRGQLEEALLLGVPEAQEPYARLIAAMALGATENSPEDLEESFRISGTMHLFAVSGLNVAIIAGILTWVAAFLGIPKSRAVLVIIPIVLFYAILTGLSPSAVRAALMASIFLAAYSIREKPRLLNSLGLAAILLLLHDTQQLFLPGFQLSFAVLLFIATLAPVLIDVFAKPFLADPFLPQSLIRPMRRSADHISKMIAASIAVSIASWLGSVGLLAWHFQSISPVGLLANVFMVPVAGWIIGLAALSLSAFGLQLTWITLIVNRLNVGLSIGLTAMAQYFAGLPAATFHTGRENGPFVSPEKDPSILRLDLMGERGEAAALLETPSEPGQPPLRWMIDTGGDHTYQARVLPLLRSRGINRIDALVITHGDQGHLGAAVPFLNQFRPSHIFESSVENRSPYHREITDLADRLGIIRVTTERGDRLRLGNGTYFTVLHPSNLEPGRLADDRALVLKLEHANSKILFTSDSGFDTEQALLESGADLRADLWIRGQHGDTPSGLPAFVNAIRPRAVISSQFRFSHGRTDLGVIQATTPRLGYRSLRSGKRRIGFRGSEQARSQSHPFCHPSATPCPSPPESSINGKF